MDSDYYRSPNHLAAYLDLNRFDWRKYPQQTLRLHSAHLHLCQNLRRLHRWGSNYSMFPKHQVIHPNQYLWNIACPKAKGLVNQRHHRRHHRRPDCLRYHLRLCRWIPGQQQGALTTLRSPAKVESATRRLFS